MIKSMEQENNHFLKQSIRREILAKRNELSEAQRQRAAVLITERILGHQWYYNSDVVLAYASYGSEISTQPLLEEILRTGKKLYLPRVCGEDMVFYRVTDLTSLQTGYKGIPEPAEDSQPYLYDEQTAARTLLLMPGVAFDMQRNRIGYGKGFYDRFLSDKQALQLRSIALAYRMQLVEAIPYEENDIRPYQVIAV